ncbi:MAG: glycosyltransferase, partial [Pseudomonadota bacterium]
AEAVPQPWPAGAEAVGFVDDLDAEHAAAAVALGPLRFGSGVKLKLVEALAHGLPAVATTSGAEGIAPAPPPALRVADAPEAFAACVAEALGATDPAGDRLAARALARERFSLEVAGARAAADLFAAADEIARARRRG